MTALQWIGGDYSYGVDRGVFYPSDSPGVSWNGLASVTEIPVGGELVGYYQNGRKLLMSQSSEEYSGAINALTYPDEFSDYNGDIELADGLIASDQRHKSFGMSYRTKVQSTDEEAYLIHLIYNASVKISDIDYESDRTGHNLVYFNWNFSTKPIKFPNFEASSHLIVDTRKTYSWILSDLENMLYGTESTDPRLPTFDELLTIFETLKITDNGDGTFTAEGPDHVVYYTDSDTAVIDWDSVVYLTPEIVEISSL